MSGSSVAFLLAILSTLSLTLVARVAELPPLQYRQQPFLARPSIARNDERYGCFLSSLISVTCSSAFLRKMSAETSGGKVVPCDFQ
jgi:hypothetical protein